MKRGEGGKERKDGRMEEGKDGRNGREGFVSRFTHHASRFTFHVSRFNLQSTIERGCI
jgi:hypothetical protein